MISVKDGPRNLPLKFGQNQVSNRWDIPDKDKCYRVKYYLYILELSQKPRNSRYTAGYRETFRFHVNGNQSAGCSQFFFYQYHCILLARSQHYMRARQIYYYTASIWLDLSSESLLNGPVNYIFVFIVTFILRFFAKLPISWTKLPIKQYCEWLWQFQFFHGCPFSLSRMSLFWRGPTLLTMPWPCLDHALTMPWPCLDLGLSLPTFL